MKKSLVGIVACIFILPTFAVGAFGHKGVNPTPSYARSIAVVSTEAMLPVGVMPETVAPEVEVERVIRPVVRKRYVPTTKSKAIILGEIRTVLAEIKRLQKKLEDLFKQL